MLNLKLKGESDPSVSIATGRRGGGRQTVALSSITDAAGLFDLVRVEDAREPRDPIENQQLGVSREKDNAGVKGAVAARQSRALAKARIVCDRVPAPLPNSRDARNARGSSFPGYAPAVSPSRTGVRPSLPVESG